MTTTSTFAPDLFNTMTDDPRWAGFGYLGGRHNWLTDTDAELPPIAARQAEVAAVDSHLLALATDRGWTSRQLFDWANSKKGRWMADAVFGDVNMLDRAVNVWHLFVKVPA